MEVQYNTGAEPNTAVLLLAPQVYQEMCPPAKESIIITLNIGERTL